MREGEGEGGVKEKVAERYEGRREDVGHNDGGNTNGGEELRGRRKRRGQR